VGSVLIDDSSTIDELLLLLDKLLFGFDGDGKDFGGELST
jgi:hypothetical protein